MRVSLSNRRGQGEKVAYFSFYTRKNAHVRAWADSQYGRFAVMSATATVSRNVPAVKQSGPVRIGHDWSDDEQRHLLGCWKATQMPVVKQTTLLNLLWRCMWEHN